MPASDDSLAPNPRPHAGVFAGRGNTRMRADHAEELFNDMVITLRVMFPNPDTWVEKGHRIPNSDAAEIIRRVAPELASTAKGSSFAHEALGAAFIYVGNEMREKHEKAKRVSMHVFYRCGSLEVFTVDVYTEKRITKELAEPKQAGINFMSRGRGGEAPVVVFKDAVARVSFRPCEEPDDTPADTREYLDSVLAPDDDDDEQPPSDGATAPRA